MIAFLSGKLVQKNPTAVTVESGGIGFEVRISVNTYRQLGHVGGKITLLTYLHVREDLMQLYGFFSTEEKELFLKLISISGIGPKLAQVILSGATVHEFIDSILAEDVSSLTRIPGIGKKTAQRLVFDLKDKLAGEGVIRKPDAIRVSAVEGAKQQEAILALVSLGYSRVNAEVAIKKVIQKNEKELTLEDLIKFALLEI